MNVALNEANALQKRIDELQEKSQSLAPKPVKERKDLDELWVEFEKVKQRLAEFSQKVGSEENEAEASVHAEQNELQQQISVLTAARDVCLQKAWKQSNICVEPLYCAGTSILR